jgi:hypothetical protein
MDTSQILNTMWDEQEFRQASLAIEWLPSIPLRILKVFAVESSIIDVWKQCLKKGFSISRALLNKKLWDDILDWRIKLTTNSVVIVHSRKVKEPFVIAFLLNENIKLKRSDVGGPGSYEAFSALHAFFTCANWNLVRASMKQLHAFSIEDSVRGNHRFNFGFTQLRVPKATNFVGPPNDSSDNMVYPRIASIQLKGKEPCDIVLDHLVRLVGLCRNALEKESIPESPGLRPVYPLRFPFWVTGYDTIQRLDLGLQPYVSGCEVMHRMSVCMFEKPGASQVSDEEGMIRLKKIKKSTEKFSSFQNTYMHIDRNDTPTFQVVMILSYLIPYECMCVMNLFDNENVMIFDDDLSDGLKFYAFGGYFHKHYHGRIELDQYWTQKCDDQAWMIRITPYTTNHAQRWCKKMREKGTQYTTALLRSLYLTDGSRYLGEFAKPTDVREKKQV